MKIVIITNRSPHHKYLCATLAQRHNLTGVIHPARVGSPGKRGFNAFRVLRRTYGLTYAVLRLGSKLPSRMSGWMVSAENRSLESRFFPEAEKDYAQINNSIVFDNVSVNTREGVDLIRQLGADIVVNLGGPIYRGPFISACKLILNYHSGLSPIYNGSGTINFAFSNGHPHLCGGTLMTMSPVIDGGRILAHYLPEIEAGDTPASLNMKTYAGAAHLYDRFISDFADRKTYSSIPQQKPLFYVRAADWTLYQTLRVRSHLRLLLAGQYARQEQVVEYWKQPDDQKAGDLLTKTLSELLWGS